MDSDIKKLLLPYENLGNGEPLGVSSRRYLKLYLIGRSLKKVSKKEGIRKRQKLSI